MTERLLGIETEYALTGAGRRRASRSSAGRRPRRLMRQVRARLPHLPDGTGRGVFLANGARFYIDVPDHPEFTTPECADPWDVVQFTQAGERILTRLAARAGGPWPAHRRAGHPALQRRLQRHRLDVGHARVVQHRANPRAPAGADHSAPGVAPDLHRGRRLQQPDGGRHRVHPVAARAAPRARRLGPIDARARHLPHQGRAAVEPWLSSAAHPVRRKPVLRGRPHGSRSARPRWSWR